MSALLNRQQHTPNGIYTRSKAKYKVYVETIQNITDRHLLIRYNPRTHVEILAVQPIHAPRADHANFARHRIAVPSCVLSWVLYLTDPLPSALSRQLESFQPC